MTVIFDTITKHFSNNSIISGMKKISFVLFLFFIIGSGIAKAQGSKLVWYTDLEKAHAQSQLTHKPIFALFTGSDWCIWCHKLDKDVFAKAAFIKWAQEKVILLELDFPRNKQLPPETAKQNNGLQQAFKVSGFPTVWIFFMDHDKTSDKISISALGSIGYPSGAVPGKEEVKFLEGANEILAKANNK